MKCDTNTRLAEIDAGSRCSACPRMFEEEHGYPVLCAACFRGEMEGHRSGLPKAVQPTARRGPARLRNE